LFAVVITGGLVACRPENNSAEQTQSWALLIEQV
jgi:hypothetical protein